MTPLNRLVFGSARRIALPIAVHPGAQLVGCTVREVATDASAQARASRAIRERLGLSVALSAMDLSVEAEAFGAEIRAADDEVPTVVGRRVTDVSHIASLAVPEVGAARTGVAIETVRRLAGGSGAPVVLGSLIGPFSLAGRLFGVSEFLELTLEDPDATHALLEKTTAFQIAYARAPERGWRTRRRHGGAVGRPAFAARPRAVLLSLREAHRRRPGRRQLRHPPPQLWSEDRPPAFDPGGGGADLPFRRADGPPGGPGQDAA